MGFGEDLTCKIHMLFMNKCQKLRDLVVISKLRCQEPKHVSCLVELLVPPRCFDGMYSLESLMYKVQDYNMECHCKWRLDCTNEILWLEVVLEVVWTGASELPLLLCW